MVGVKRFSRTSKLTVEGTVKANGFYAIAGNGSKDNGGYVDNCDITVNDGAVISAPNGIAIYHPELGTVTVNGGTISGHTGIELCAGKLVVSGGSITSTGDNWNATGSQDAILDGAAISIINRDYPGGVPTAVITGGTIKATGTGLTVKAYDYTNNAVTDWTDAGAHVNISGGTFSSIPDNMDALCADGCVPVKNANGYTVAEGTYVAEVGGKKFASLTEAIEAAESGVTVTLLADINTPETTYKITKSLTIDLNGKTVTGSGYDGVFEVTGENVNVVINATNGGKVIAVENNGSAGKYAMAIWMCGAGSTLTINGGEFSQKIIHTDDEQMDMIYTSKGVITINGGTFHSGTPKWTLNISDSAYKAGTANIIVNGGTFVGYDPRNAENEGKGTSLVAAGVGINKDENGNFTAAPNMAAQIVDADGSSVAAYAGHYDAIAAAKDGETVILLSDRQNYITNTINKNITIDLNGKTLSVGNNNPFFRTNGEVTIQNGTITSNLACAIVNAYNKLALKNVKITGVTGGNGKNLVNVCSNAEVTIDKDTVLTASGSGVAVFIGQDAVAKYTLNVYGKVIQESKSFAICGNGSYEGTTTINIYDDAEVKSASAAIYQPQAGAINVYGGLVEGYCAIGIKSGTLNISGGTVRGTADDHKLDDSNSVGDGLNYDGSAIIVDSRAASYAGNVKINVTGGTVESYYSTAIREIGNDPSVTQLTELTVTGGEVLGASQSLGNVSNDMLVRDISVKNVSVSDGTFNHEVQPGYCAIGFVPCEHDTETGKYTVKAAEGNAAYYDADGKLLGYADVDKAMVLTGVATIKLIKTATVNGVLALQNNITLDLNGHELSAQMLVGFVGTVIDSSEGEGLLKLANKDYLTLNSTNAYLPLYDTTAQGYRFFSYEFKARGIASGGDTSGDKKQFWFSIVFGGDQAYALLKNANHGLGIKLSLAVGSNAPMEATVPQAAITQWVNAVKINGGSLEGEKTGFYMAVKGLSKIGSDTVKVGGIVETHGVKNVSDSVLTHTNAN